MLADLRPRITKVNIKKKDIVKIRLKVSMVKMEKPKPSALRRSAAFYLPRGLRGDIALLGEVLDTVRPAVLLDLRFCI